MPSDTQRDNVWGSRHAYFAAILCSIIGLNSYALIPQQAVTDGALGSILVSVLTYAALGVPLLYMEHAVAQFTARDCLQVWTSRGCLSYLGYIHIFYQLYFIVFCHTINSAVVHYLLISFEDPIPFSQCGPWADKNCDLIRTNYSIVRNCIRDNKKRDYCENLYLTYPEYQYWRYYILGLNQTDFHIAWRVGVASLLLIIVVYVSCFRRLQSVQYAVRFLCVAPTIAYIILTLGSMMQKGLMMHYEESMDASFNKYTESIKLSNTMAEVLYGLNLGTGLSFNLASTTDFRSPTYTNIVMAVFISCIACVMGICTTAMMPCPYAYQLHISPAAVLNDRIHYTFEKIPRLLHYYNSSSVWLTSIFCSIALSAASWEMIMVAGLMEMLAQRKPFVAKYQGSFTLVMMVLLHTVALCMVSNWTFYTVVNSQKVVRIITLLMVVIENLVFILWYGLGKFSDDIHFMQGSHPGLGLRMSWLATSVVVSYVVCMEIYHQYVMKKDDLGHRIGWWIFCGNVAWIVLTPAVSLLIGAIRRKSYELVRLDPRWGPREKVLRRSRALFSAHSMTKEYMYRQYHLQAGIIERQKRANLRSPWFIGRSSPLVE